MAPSHLDVQDAEAPAPQRPGTRVPSARPALVVLAVAATIVLLFGIGAVLAGSSHPGRVRHPTVRGVSLATEPAGPALRPIERPDTPPADVLGSLVVPKGARATSSKPWNGLTVYSGTMGFSLRTSQAAVVTFFRRELRARGWSIMSVGAAHNAPSTTEVLAQRSSSDGWYWDVGVLVAPTTFGSHAQAGVDTTHFTLEIYEVLNSD